MAYTIASPEMGTANVSSAALSELFNASTEAAFRYSGMGSFLSTWQTVLSGVDRFGINPLPPNHEVTGLIFITRPKLNLSSMSLKQDRVLSTLNTREPYSFPFSIRSYLDSRFARDALNAGDMMVTPFVNTDLPFIIPLTNCHMSSGGWPDFFIDTETSQGGFFGEDQTIARGSDFNARSYDFSLTFRDIQGGYIMALFYYWVYYIAAQCRGLVIPYPEDIYAQRLNYTCSIYRFVLDPSRQFITKWSKATGCFPKSVPIGDAFNVPTRENYIHATQEFTIPFQVNHVSYMDPIVFQEFNTIVQRWAGSTMADSIPTATATDTFDYDANRKKSRVRAPIDAYSNFRGIPWINSRAGYNQLDFWALPEELEDPSVTIIRQLQAQTSAVMPQGTEQYLASYGPVGTTQLSTQAIADPPPLTSTTATTTSASTTTTSATTGTSNSTTLRSTATLGPSLDSQIGTGTNNANW